MAMKGCWAVRLARDQAGRAMLRDPAVASPIAPSAYASPTLSPIASAVLAATPACGPTEVASCRVLGRRYCLVLSGLRDGGPTDLARRLFSNWPGVRCFFDHGRLDQAPSRGGKKIQPAGGRIIG
jgi:hypothetical protein